MESYTVNAYFYQLKPIWQESFLQADGFCAQGMRAGAEKKPDPQMQKAGSPRSVWTGLCTVRSRDGHWSFHMQNGEQLESVGSMDDLSGQLAKYNNFLRAHRSYLVNMEYIKRFLPKQSSW